jgi:hypothetical protein
MTKVDSNVILLDSPEEGACRVVTGDWDMQNLTADGWILIGIIQETVVEMQQKEYRDPPSEQCYGGASHMLQTPVTVTQTSFLLRATKDQTIKDLVDARDNLHSELHESKGAHNAATQLAKDNGKALEAAQKDIEALKGKLDSSISESESMRAEATTHRRQMQKLREALGAIRMNEIIGEEAA